MIGSRAHLAAAAFLLLFASVDMLLPGFCEVEEPPVTPHAHAAATAVEAPAHDAPLVDDCFCCCAHIVPRPLWTFVTTSQDVALAAARPVQLPPVRADRLYHPPRA